MNFISTDRWKWWDCWWNSQCRQLAMCPTSNGIQPPPTQNQSSCRRFRKQRQIGQWGSRQEFIYWGKNLKTYDNIWSIPGKDVR